MGTSLKSGATYRAPVPPSVEPLGIWKILGQEEKKGKKGN